MLTFYMTVIDGADEKVRFEQIYNQYQKQMFFLAKSILDSYADAEDVVHDVFLQIATRHIKKVCGIADPDALRNYLLKATKNTCLNYKRRREIPFAPEDMPSHKGSTVPSDSELIDLLCIRIQADQLIHMLLTLPDLYREVLYLRLVLEFSIGEIAKFTGQTDAAVRKQLVRGKKKLLETINELEDTQNVYNTIGI